MTDKEFEKLEKNRIEEYRIAHERLGCGATCKYCSLELLNKGPCCCFIYEIAKDYKTGECLTKREVE